MRARGTSSSTSNNDPAPAEPVAYGWTRPVMADAFPAGEQPLGSAATMIDGHSLGEIVTNPAVRIRGDDQACVTCHAWASAESRDGFCDRVPGFVELPTANGDGHDDLAAKPLVLKQLLERWHAAGCPD